GRLARLGRGDLAALAALGRRCLVALGLLAQHETRHLDRGREGAGTLRSGNRAAPVHLDDRDRELLAVLEPRYQVGKGLQLTRQRQTDRHLPVGVERLFLHHLGTLYRDSLFGSERVRALLKRRRAQRAATSRKEPLARLLESLLQRLALRLQRIRRAEDARRARQLLLAFGDLVGDLLAILAQRDPHPQVGNADDREREDAQDDALIAARVTGIPALDAAHERLQPCTQRIHRTTSATIEKRSLSPCLVVGDAKFTFLKRLDFPSDVMRSEAERAWPSIVSRPPRRLKPVRYASAG